METSALSGLGLASILSYMPPPAGFDEESAVAEGLAALTLLDRRPWGAIIERRLRNPDSTIWIHIPKDGVVASALNLVGRFWLAWISGGCLLVGIALLSIPSSNVAFKAVGWPLVVLGVVAFGLGVFRGIQASQARRSWRRSRPSGTP